MKFIIFMLLVWAMGCCAKPVYISLEMIEVDCTNYTNEFYQYSKNSKNLCPKKLVPLSYELQHEETIKILIFEHYQKLSSDNESTFSTWQNNTKLKLSVDCGSININLVGEIKYDETDFYKGGNIQFKTIAPLKIGDSEILYWSLEESAQKKLIRFIRLHTGFNATDEMKHDLKTKQVEPAH